MPPHMRTKKSPESAVLDSLTGVSHKTMVLKGAQMTLSLFEARRWVVCMPAVMIIVLCC